MAMQNVKTELSKCASTKAPSKAVFGTFLMLFVLLGAVAAVGGFRVSDDSFQHFVKSVEVVRRHDFARLVTDIWNKPVPMVLYGVSGLAGIVSARLVSVVLTVW